MRSTLYYITRSIVRAVVYTVIVVALFIGTTMLTANLFTAFLGAAGLTGLYLIIRNYENMSQSIRRNYENISQSIRRNYKNMSQSIR